MRFRKQWNFHKWLRVAVSHRGRQLVIGPRGCSISFGKNGTFLNVGLRGTGFSKRTKLSGPKELPKFNFKFNFNLDYDFQAKPETPGGKWGGQTGSHK